MFSFYKSFICPYGVSNKDYSTIPVDIVYILTIPNIFKIIIFFLDDFTNANTSLQLITRFSQNRIHGSILFSQHSSNDDIIQISVSLNNFGESSQWSWQIKEFPVDYSVLADRCTDKNLGNK